MAVNPATLAAFSMADLAAALSVLQDAGTGEDIPALKNAIVTEVVRRLKGGLAQLGVS
jgi:hypothetical protein